MGFHIAVLSSYVPEKKTMDLHLCAKGQGGLQLFVDLSK
jgi:hypothetical protein